MGNTPGPDLLLDWDISDESPSPPRFSPASPLPPEVEEWIGASTQEAHPQTILQRASAPQEPRLVLVLPPASKPGQDFSLLDEPDNVAPSSSEAVTGYFDNGQLLTREEHKTVLPEAGIPEPELLQAENPRALPEAGANEIVLPRPEYSENPRALPETGPGVNESALLWPEERALLSVPPARLDRQSVGHTAGKSVQPSRLSPASPPQPEHGKRVARKRRWQTGILFLIMIGLLILAGGHFLGSLVNLNSSQTTTRSTSIDDALNEQAIATAESSNTNPYVSGGTLVFSDTLNSASPNWDQNTDCAFTDSGYRVTTGAFQACALNTHQNLANFVLEVNVSLLRGDVGGLFFRAKKHAHKTNAYLLDFDSKGNYQIWDYGTSTGLKLLARGISSDLNAGYNHMNTIALVAQGPNITLYINGHRVEHLTDNAYSKGGLSLISSEYTHHTGVSQAAYKDLRLWQL